MSSAARLFPLPDPEHVYRLNIDQWHSLIENGTLTNDDPVELLEGVPVFKMPKNPSHRIVVSQLTKLLIGALPKGWSAQFQEPVTLGDSEPEPDGAVIRGTASDYPDRHPGVGDITLVIEVAEATLERDRTAKHRIYARAQIPSYWIINLIDRQIEVHSQPSGETELPNFKSVDIFKAGQSVNLVIDGNSVITINASDLLPPKP